MSSARTTEISPVAFDMSSTVPTLSAAVIGLWIVDVNVRLPDVRSTFAAPSAASRKLPVVLLGVYLICNACQGRISDVMVNIASSVAITMVSEIDSFGISASITFTVMDDFVESTA